MCFARETEQKSITVSLILIFMLVAGYFVSCLQAHVHVKRSTPTPAARNFSRETFPTRKPGMAEKLSGAPERPDAESPKANKIAPTFMPSSQLELGNNFFCSVCPPAVGLANRGRISSVGRALDCRAGGRGFDSRGRTNTQGLKNN